ncbi:hypothetical protein [Tateyamaria pelophila]|jgi:hypothetical protein|uniref:hypothetical protein n=1 Tax=Tateyamaria pelophila TaxID=328415 RepID=UPI001CBB892F|nr:hypothetical protein [Tateyamaria pelophila]
MQFDIPHIIVTAIILYSVIWGMQHISPFSEMSKGKRNGIQFIILFVLLFILNIIWPYGSGA